MTDVVNVGSTDNDGTGDTLRAAFSQINTRFNELLSTIDGGDAWATGVTYTATPIRQWVIESGQAYVAAVNHVSGASFAADLSAGKWFAVDSAQILADLAAPTGASLIGYTPTGLLTATTVEGALNEVRDASKVSYTPAGTGAVATNVQTKLMESVSVLDFYANGVDGVRVDPTGVVDSTLGIQAALNTGFDVSGVGSFKTTSTLTMSSTQGQKFVISGSIQPAFRGDVLRVIAFSQNCDVPINGVNQPVVGTAGAAFVIGYGGANAQQASVAGSRVINFVGDAVRWEQGSMVNFTDFHAQSITGDGILCTSNYDDNNHGYFANTHIVSCSGVGYNIKSDAGFGSNLNSRHHVFSNAKAFGCGKNFFIGTTGNIGSVFSELGTAPDEFGVDSTGNDIQVVETSTALAAWIDNATQGLNSLAGYNSYKNWCHQNSIHKRLTLQDTGTGRMIIEQVGANVFQNAIEATTANVLVTHSKGSAAQRTDVFSDRIQFAGAGSPIVISYSQTGTITPTVGALAAGASTNYSVVAASSGSGTGDTAIATLSMGATSNLVSCACNIEQNGDLTIILTNHAAISVTLGAVTIRWIVMKHYA